MFLYMCVISNCFAIGWVNQCYWLLLQLQWIQSVCIIIYFAIESKSKSGWKCVINFYWKQFEYIYISSTKAVEKEYKKKSIVIEIISNLKTFEIDDKSEYYEHKILLDQLWSIVTDPIGWTWIVNERLQLVCKLVESEMNLKYKNYDLPFYWYDLIRKIPIRSNWTDCWTQL